MQTTEQLKKIYAQILDEAKEFAVRRGETPFNHTHLDIEINGCSDFRFSIYGTFRINNDDETGGWKMEDVDFTIYNFEAGFFSDEQAFEINEDGTTRELWEPFPLFDKLGEIFQTKRN